MYEENKAPSGYENENEGRNIYVFHSCVDHPNAIKCA